MAEITIGGTLYRLPEMNFLAMERAWPYVVEATETIDPMKGASASLAIFAAALMEADDFDQTQYGLEADVKGDVRIHNTVTRFLKKKLKANELGAVRDTMFDVLKEAGLEVTEGEAVAALKAALEAPQEQNDLTETAPDTSSSSSQPESKGEAGTS